MLKQIRASRIKEVMKLMSTQGKNMFKTAIELFLGEPILGFNAQGDSMEFLTRTGSVGFMETGFMGDMSIWVGDELVYEVENELIPVLEHTNDRDLLDLYEYAKNIDQESLKYKSRLFLDIVQGSIEKILLVGKLALEGRTIIGTQEVIYKDGKKFLISLN